MQLYQRSSLSAPPSRGGSAVRRHPGVCGEQPRSLGRARVSTGTPLLPFGAWLMRTKISDRFDRGPALRSWSKVTTMSRSVPESLRRSLASEGSARAPDAPAQRPSPRLHRRADAGPSSTVSSSRPLTAERRRRGRADGSAVRRPLVKSAELRGSHRGADGATAVPGALDTLRSECSSDGEHGLAEPVEEPPRALRPPADRLSRLAASESEDRCRELDTD
jgi:hypothetical protein